MTETLADKYPGAAPFIQEAVNETRRVTATLLREFQTGRVTVTASFKDLFLDEPVNCL
ncbi:hypothetical protein SAMN05444271_1281 [Halohasta litchfieldiae]|jgi:hypothetical protein|uniref:Uncharacterized protein n=1 Tax=Halohasta litchfieldiae TaxID=1073996 RepID=A0A1H6WKQ0_9EURY|nr:hypothetical protein SAMN05444271_1281 [Halohasta litchfieldiae]